MIVDERAAIPSITREAGHVSHKRIAPPGQAIEKRRLTNVRATNKSQCGCKYHAVGYRVEISRAVSEPELPIT